MPRPFRGDGILFGLAPAMRATRLDLAPQLREAAATTTPQRGLGRLLVASQIALSVVLLFGAGLFVRTFRNLDGQNLGFERENLLLFEVDPDRSGYKDDSGIALHIRLLERIQGLPGVRSATYSQLAQVRHRTVVFSDFEAIEKRNFRVCSGGF